MADSFLSSLSRRVSGILPKKWRRDLPVVPVVRLSGAIGMATTPFARSLSLAGTAQALDKAFAMTSAPAVALLINSPGGSPVQSHLIFRRIRALAEEKEKHVFAFVEDAAASGGYMIACAADEIFADPCSIVGSIGVVTAGFGFDKAIEKLGVERRVFTAGKRKVTLDPFRPTRPEDVERLDVLLKELHTVFVDLVRSRRGDALPADDETLFSGEFWLGTQAAGLGLVDGLGDVRSILKARYGEDVRMPLVQSSSGLIPRRPGGFSGGFSGALAGTLAAQAADGAMAAVEERALWSRLGL
ncbi:S49 family peptidase [Xanthobacter autotrophicus]|uniref:S49 family peptidase n=1 Tax=Xanthobacter autotrophicus TaxID=280 RepID=UPI0024A68FE4|nr:S49 family peptidase [Xanthobacter autotrophicus]MDI4657299.1 S49 family peptidase [Xanthobacter autotrophicus]